MQDPFDLERFVRAQSPVFDTVVAELQHGRKHSHWMWFVFPQLRGLGRSAMAQRYGIGSLAEARAYLDHSVLGPRLVQCTALVLAIERSSLRTIFGTPDDDKFRSSMTLFARAAQDEGGVFVAALDRFCAGRHDTQTLTMLEAPR